MTGFAPQVPGNTGQGEEIDARVDGYGNVDVQLSLLCNNDYHVTHPEHLHRSDERDPALRGGCAGLVRLRRQAAVSRWGSFQPGRGKWQV